MIIELETEAGGLGTLGFFGRKKRKRQQADNDRMQHEANALETTVRGKMERLQQLQAESDRLDSEIAIANSRLGLSSLGIVDTVVSLGKGLLSKIGGRMKAAKERGAELSGYLAQLRADSAEIDAAISALDISVQSKRAIAERLRTAVDDRSRSASSAQAVHYDGTGTGSAGGTGGSTKWILIGSAVVVLGVGTAVAVKRSKSKGKTKKGRNEENQGL